MSAVIHEAGHAVACMALGGVALYVSDHYFKGENYPADPYQEIIIDVAGWAAEVIDEEGNDACADAVHFWLDIDCSNAAGYGEVCDCDHAYSLAERMRKTHTAQRKIVLRACSDAIELLRKHWDDVVAIASKSEAEDTRYVYLYDYKLSQPTDGVPLTPNSVRLPTPRLASNPERSPA